MKYKERGTGNGKRGTENRERATGDGYALVSIDGLARIVILKFAAFLPFFLEGESLLSELNG